MSEFRCCALVPTYDNPMTIESVVDRIRPHLSDIIIVDDGSAQPGREACERLAREGRADCVRLEKNSGKGAAVKAGLEAASRAGFTHAFQIDADGQHEIERMPEFLEAAKARPREAIVAYPIYDESVPNLRLKSREITRFWVDLEVGGRGIIRDAMIGFRVYPVEATRALAVAGDRMEFDVECIVRLYWAGTPVHNLPVGVRYLTAEEGGKSHFEPFMDNVRISLMHSRLCSQLGTDWCLRKLGFRQSPGLGPS